MRRPTCPKWGLAVDLARCTGCSACVTACYAENNIPWVGEDEVRLGREMSWMRIERYWEGGEDGEAARGPVHPDDVPALRQRALRAGLPGLRLVPHAGGLNGQVYNRCVGTRYCGNNCPYKVRYFNWFAYAKKAFPEPLASSSIPEVTVRARGVMEKCTFCVQRIRSAAARRQAGGRAVRDGDVVTACAQACPSGAITFGNVKDPGSRVEATSARPARVPCPRGDQRAARRDLPGESPPRDGGLSP